MPLISRHNSCPGILAEDKIEAIQRKAVMLKLRHVLSQVWAAVKNVKL